MKENVIPGWICVRFRKRVSFRQNDKRKFFPQGNVILSVQKTCLTRFAIWQIVQNIYTKFVLHFLSIKEVSQYFASHVITVSYVIDTLSSCRQNEYNKQDICLYQWCIACSCRIKIWKYYPRHIYYHFLDSKCEWKVKKSAGYNLILYVKSILDIQ